MTQKEKRAVARLFACATALFSFINPYTFPNMEFLIFLYTKTHTKSANSHPMGTETQMPVTPIHGTADKRYASATRVPREMTVSTTDIPGRFIAR